MEDTVNPQFIRNRYQLSEFVCVPRHGEHVLANGAALFHLTVKELFGGLIALHSRVSLKNEIELLNDLEWVVVLKALLKLRF